MKDFIKKLFNPQGEISSKRVVTFLAFILVMIGFLANLFWDYTIEDFIYSSVMYIVIAGLGIVGAEKFIGNKK
tara:strand:- start:273 stop:491 length:219 start_codon:yes stop_codon:yes gene_type:complete